MSSVVQAVGSIVGSVIQPLILPVVEKNLVPDIVLRAGIKAYIAGDLARVKRMTATQVQEHTRAFVKELKGLPIAVSQKEANEQHYEVPDEFYQLVLGPHLKYSSGYWPTETTTLAESEVAMLELYCERAEIEDGMTLVDLGCGWGSVTLFMAAKYPNCKITSISNSNTQRAFILDQGTVHIK
jgi:tRNA G46 methylase TrmB